MIRDLLRAGNPVVNFDADAGGASKSDPTAACRPECGVTTPLPKVKSVRDLGPQFAVNPHRMVGQDGAFSIPLGDGAALWFFGDTLVGRRIPGESLWYPGGKPVGHADMSGKAGIERLINNTGLVLREASGRYGLRGYAYICDAEGELRPLIPLARNEDPDWDRIWCLHGCALGEFVFLYYIKVRMLEDGPFPVNFEVVGSGLARGRRREFQFERVTVGGNEIFWGKDDPHFAAAVLPDPEGSWLYLFGVAQDARGRQRCSLARVLPGMVDHPDRYEYLVTPSPAWGTDVQRVTTVFTDAPNELSVSWNAHLGAFLAVHSFNITGDIVARTAPAPWGPWSEPVHLWTVHPLRARPLPYPPLVYAAKEHPELAEENGRIIYLTYVEFEEYFPHLMEVTFR